MKHITDPTFKYTCAAKTDIRKTFAKAFREIQAKREADMKLDRITNVRQINRG